LPGKVVRAKSSTSRKLTPQPAEHSFAPKPPQARSPENQLPGKVARAKFSTPRKTHSPNRRSIVLRRNLRRREAPRTSDRAKLCSALFLNPAHQLPKLCTSLAQLMFGLVLSCRQESRFSACLEFLNKFTCERSVLDFSQNLLHLFSCIFCD